MPVVISIHAPTRGATLSLSGYPVIYGISIHAPTRGATFSRWWKRQVISNFNPRSHEGSDPKTMRSTMWHWDFNPRSHEGSDTIAVKDGKAEAIFQSTLPRGERLCCLAVTRSNIKFQSTLPRGERRVYESRVYCISNFNPRSHEGSDE